MRRTERKINIHAMVRAMTEAGAEFYFTDNGTLLVQGLDSLPLALQDEFFECDGRELVTHIKQLMAAEAA